MRPPSPWAAGFAPDRPSLLHAGLGRGWWAWSRGLAVADDHRLWVLDGARATPLPAPEVEQVGEDDAGLVATAGAQALRLAPTGAVRLEDHGRRRAIPSGGDAEVWVDDEAGYVYRRAAGRVRAVEALAPGEPVRVGPHGALLVGWPARRGGAPGRSPRPLPVALGEPIRWSPDGLRVAGTTDDGGVVVDLLTGRAEPLGGIPVAVDAWLHEGRIWRRGSPIRRGLVEASAAAWGPWLAGPGGWIWSLRTGSPVTRRRAVALGATVGTPSGFVTVDWESGRGWTVGFDGRRRLPFLLPLDPDDTVAAGRGEGEAVWLETALGERFRVVGGAVTRDGAAPDLDPPMPSRIPTPAGPFQATVQTELDGQRFAANDDGWLISAPAR